ncbi:MAG: hypothetical protein FJ271_10075 [Planctomycetes bacterium]|nr:hypothetical protein [Planctomycetota bacterium]
MNGSASEHHFVESTRIGQLPALDQDAFATAPELGRGRSKTLPAALIVGVLAGIPVGSVVGTGCCWLIEYLDHIWVGALLGAVGGALAGGLIAFAERQVRGELVRPDTATMVAVVLNLIPALLILLFNLAWSGKMSYWLATMVFAGPLLGLLIGGMLDRSYEAFQRGALGGSFVFAFIGLAGCGGLLFAIDQAAYGPSPNQVARETRDLLASEWRDDKEMNRATLDQVTLTRKGRNTYEGFADVSFDVFRERLALEVTVKYGMISVQTRLRED